MTIELQPMDDGNTRLPSADDQYMLEESKVPASLNLIDIVYPKVDPLFKIMAIAEKYQWTSAHTVVTTNYDEVAADLALLESTLVLQSNLEGGVDLAHNNMESNRDTVSNYHFQRIRKREDAAYNERLMLYKEKKIPKPDRATDTLIKAEVEVILAMLKFPEELNKLKALNKQVKSLMKRSDSLVIVLQSLLKRAESRGF